MQLSKQSDTLGKYIRRSKGNGISVGKKVWDDMGERGNHGCNAKRGRAEPVAATDRDEVVFSEVASSLEEFLGGD